MMPAVDVGLAVLVLAVAVWTIVARDTFAAVVGFVTYGLLLTLVWVRLDAVDVALTETAIGSGLTGVLLLGAAARLRVTERRAAAERPATPVRLAAAALSAAVTAALAPVCSPAPPGAHARGCGRRERRRNRSRQRRRASYGLSRDGHAAGESRPLLALVGVWSLAPDRLWGGSGAAP
jgi:uncharacterized MnhB-related membrane protein